jgi:hypothetical protein
MECLFVVSRACFKYIFVLLRNDAHLCDLRRYVLAAFATCADDFFSAQRHCAHAGSRHLQCAFHPNPERASPMTAGVFTSVGLHPPERHADRVVAEMLQRIAELSSHLMPAIAEVVGNSSDGSPKAQRKLEQRLRSAGAFSTSLEPGKRGRYTLFFFSWGGWNPTTKSPIAPGDQLPGRPWLAVYACKLQSEGRGAGRVTLKAAPAVLITHHALSRLAQRAGARTGNDLINAMFGFLDAATELLTSKPVDTPPRRYLPRRSL